MTRREAASPIDAHIGNQIRQRRVALQMSQDHLATVIGVTFQQVQKYEKGTNRVAGSTMYAIMRALNVKPEYFFQGLDTPADGVVEAMPLDTRTMKLATAFQRIPEGELKTAIAKLVAVSASAE